MVMINLPTAGVDYHVPFGGTPQVQLWRARAGLRGGGILHPDQDRLYRGADALTESSDTRAVYPSLKGKRVLITGGGSRHRRGASSKASSARARTSASSTLRGGLAARWSRRSAASCASSRSTSPTFARDSDRRSRGLIEERGAGATCWSTMPPMTTATARGGDARILGRAAEREPAPPCSSAPRRWCRGCARRAAARSSISARSPGISACPTWLLYETAKAAIEGLTRALARELGPDGHPRHLRRSGQRATPRQLQLVHAGRRGGDRRGPVPQGAAGAGRCRRAGAVPRLRRCAAVHRPRIFHRRGLAMTG